jgi:ABC-2 type transport system ATP-binding protein
MRRMGKKQLIVELREPLGQIPDALAEFNLDLSGDGLALTYSYDTQKDRTGITALLSALSSQGIVLRDLATRQSSLEEIFVGLVKEGAA